MFNAETTARVAMMNRMIEGAFVAAGNAKHYAAAIEAILVPTVLGGFMALPDHSGATRAEADAVIAADYDRRYALSPAYYARDTSGWAGR